MTLDAARTSTWIPIASLALALFLDPVPTLDRSVKLMRPGGDPLVVASGRIAAIYPSSNLLNGVRRLSRVLLLGRGRVDVIEPVESIVGRTGAPWIRLTLRGAAVNALEDVDIYVNRGEVASLEPSLYRRVGSAHPLTRILFSDGSCVTVTEDLDDVSRQLGAS